jgi:TatD DNase family protein
MWNYVDIHSHLNFSKFDTDRDAVITKLKEENIATITVGTDLKTSEEAIALTSHENLYATIGVHPADDASQAFDEQAFIKLVEHQKVVAIGECGLDYARLPTDTDAEKKRQKDDFEKQIEFAVKYKKPLMIHCRDAYDDCLALLKSKKSEYGDALRGNFHFFTSPVSVARQCLELDFTVSFTGPITYTTDYDEVVAFVPLEKLMAETDAPFAAPVPYRGTRNEPTYVKEVVQKIAQIKGISVEEARIATVNTAFYTFFKDISSKSV